jgi:pimeloyl-ACP methyl ester carboxylesterase
MLMPVLCLLVLAPAPAVESKFVQVAPVAEGGKWVRSPAQTRAVVLIHGFTLHVRSQSVPRAGLRPWQQPDSPLVKELARDSDVFVFAYGQDASIMGVVEGSGLAGHVARLRHLGYRDVVLVGHSAGGLIARQFVEDHPGAGVTKVIQVCPPNGGSPSAHIKVPRSQRPFLDCLTVEGRKQCLKARADVRIPEAVQFVCVVGGGHHSGTGDGIVPCQCQWTDDLQDQGIPAVKLSVTHREAVRSPQGARALADLVRHDQPRWPADRVRAARKGILGAEK